MERVTFALPTGETSVLRPVHAIRIAAQMAGRLKQNGTGLTAQGDDIRKAALAVREEYRCRDVRKETRRVGLLGAAEEEMEIIINCADQAVIDEMIKANNA